MRGARLGSRVIHLWASRSLSAGHNRLRSSARDGGSIVGAKRRLLLERSGRLLGVKEPPRLARSGPK